MSASSGGKLVIGLCTYNRGEPILRTLEALDRLDPVGGRVARVVIVENRCTDSTPDVVRAFLRSRAAGSTGIPMELWSEPEPGKVQAMRRLFNQTTEEFVGIVDDDTLPDPGWARGMLECLDAAPRAAAVGGPVENLWEPGPTRIARIYRRSLGDQLLGEHRHRLDDPRAFLMGASTVYRREAVIDSGWLRDSVLDCRRGETLLCGEDAELCIRLRRTGWQIWYEPAARMRHIIPASRQTTAYIARLRESIAASEPWIQWLAATTACPAAIQNWARGNLARARRLHLKTMLFDWRPTRRRVRLAERRGRVRGWQLLSDYLREYYDPPAQP